MQRVEMIFPPALSRAWSTIPVLSASYFISASFTISITSVLLRPVLTPKKPDPALLLLDELWEILTVVGTAPGEDPAFTTSPSSPSTFTWKLYVLYTRAHEGTIQYQLMSGFYSLSFITPSYNGEKINPRQCIHIFHVHSKGIIISGIEESVIRNKMTILCSSYSFDLISVFLQFFIINDP